MKQKTGNENLTGSVSDSPKPWLEAVKDAMRESADYEAERRNTATDFNYRWEHVKAVVRQARKLARLSGADMDIVVAAAWLHDVRKDKGERHPEFGARFAKKVLPLTDFPPDKIPAVAQAIREHMGLWRDEPLQTLESQVLWDADKLTKIGLTSAIHWFGESMNRGRIRKTSDFIKEGMAPDWHDKTVSSMHTDAARKIAAQRLEARRNFFTQLKDELSGNDIDLL